MNISKDAMDRIRKALEKINEQMYNEVYKKPTKPSLRVIPGGKS